MYITKKSLLRKLSIISLAVLVFVSSLLGSNASTANAVGVDTVVKLAGGKAVVRSLAEKAGMQLSTRQTDNMVALIEKKTFEGDQKAIDFVNKANNVIDMPSTEPATKSGFKKYVLDPALWLSGLDLIFDAVQAFKDGYDSNTPIDSMCVITVTPASNKVYYTSGANYWAFNVYIDGVFNSLIKTAATSSDSSNNRTMIHDQWGIEVLSGSESLYSNGTIYNTDGSRYKGVTARSDLNVDLRKAYIGDCVVTKEVLDTDVVDVTNVNNNVINNFNNDTYNTNTTYNIEIEMPDTLNKTDITHGNTTVWNLPDPEIEIETTPPSPPTPIEPDSDGDGIPDSEDDSDGDGTTDDKDSNADGDGFLENLLGIVALIAIFDLLKAVIFYLARMFEFILTIPLIDAKPIDNIAFDWFRNAEIIGIEIYSVISLLATVGLSFAVYKVVRRLLP